MVKDYLEEQVERLRKLDADYSNMASSDIPFDQLLEMWYRSERERIRLSYGHRMSSQQGKVHFEDHKDEVIIYGN